MITQSEASRRVPALEVDIAAIGARLGAVADMAPCLLADVEHLLTRPRVDPVAQGPHLARELVQWARGHGSRHGAVTSSRLELVGSSSRSPNRTGASAPVMDIGRPVRLSAPWLPRQLWTQGRRGGRGLPVREADDVVVAENLAEPSGRPLTRSRIVDACLRLVEREGVAGLSMRKLADALGKTPMAVYRHVADKRELLSLVVAEVSGQFVVPAAEGSPRDQIIGAVESVHHVLDRHRWMVTAMLDGELLAPSSLRLSEFLLAAMRRAGLSVEQAALLHVAIWQYVFGHLLIGHGVASRMLPSSFERFAESGGDPDEYPMIRDTALTLANLDHAARFGVGLRALVDGMLARSAPD